MMKRQRGRGRNPGQKPQGNNPNRAYESNGPDIKVRGSAQTVFEKYQQLARDANSSGDRVLGENYLQHAEHYFRVIRAMQPAFVPRSEMMIAGYDDESEDGQDNGEGSDGEIMEGGEANGQPDFNPNQNRNNNREPRYDQQPREPRPPRQDFRQDGRPDTRGEPRADGGNEPRVEGDEDRYGRRRRRRPDRFGNEGGYSGRPNGENGSMDQNRAPRGDGQAENRFDGQDAQPNDGHKEQPAASFAEPEAFSQPQEIVAAADPANAPAARERRPRPPRPPRVPREPREADSGFGDDMPAFLATPVPTSAPE